MIKPEAFLRAKGPLQGSLNCYTLLDCNHQHMLLVKWFMTFRNAIVYILDEIPV